MNGYVQVIYVVTLFAHWGHRKKVSIYGWGPVRTALEGARGLYKLGGCELYIPRIPPTSNGSFAKILTLRKRLTVDTASSELANSHLIKYKW